jgi:hypothetical protein
MAESNTAVLAPAALPDAPAIQPTAVPSPEQNTDLFKAIGPAGGLGPHRDASVRVSVEPVQSSRLGQLARSLPLVGKSSRHTDYVPPSPSPNQPAPDPPKHKVTPDLNIAVRVYVTASGKVEYAEVLSPPIESLDRDLAAWAVFSARRWQFEPARTKAGAVAGQVVLRYTFGRATEADTSSLEPQRSSRRSQ